MTLYEIIYTFLQEFIFNGGETADGLMGATYTLFDISIEVREWFCHLTTLVILFGLLFCAFLFVRWLFRLGANLIRVR